MSYFDDASLVMIPSGYKDQKVYSVKPLDGSGDLTFSRASSATRVASNGLIEKVRTNLALYSEDLTNAAWTNFSITVSANAGTAPNGTTTADKLIPTASSTNHLIHTNQITSAGEYSFSVYVKASGYSKVAIRESWTTGDYTSFNLSTGAVIDSAGSYTNTITSVGDGWYRITATKSYSGNIALGIIPLLDSYTGGSPLTSYAGNGTSGVLAWGAQMEFDVPTAYIATTSAAVSVGPVSGLPRLDYLNSTCPRLILEPQRSNALTYSEQIDNADWLKLNVTIAANTSDTLDPAGYNGADKITDNSTNAAHFVYRFSTWDTTQRTASVYAKAGTSSRVCILNGTTNAGVFANLSSGTISVSAGFTGTITSVGNGWYRITATHTAASSQTFAIGLFTGTDTTDYVGTGSYAYLWGAQLEAGAYATSYIPTLGTSVTRVADAASKTGISSLIGQTEGTIFLEVAVNNANSGNGVFFECIGASTADTFVLFIDATNNNLAFFNSDGTGLSEVIQTGYVPSTTVKIALGYKNSNFAVYVNGVSKSISALNMVPTALANIYLNSNRSGGEVAQSTYKQLLLFPTRLSNSDLAALTA